MAMSMRRPGFFDARKRQDVMTQLTHHKFEIGLDPVSTHGRRNLNMNALPIRPYTLRI